MPTTFDASRRLASRAAAATIVLGALTLAAGAAQASASQPARANPPQVPEIATKWAAAWNSASPQKMAALFTADGIYEDLAFQATFRGRENVTTWVTITNQAVRDPHIQIHDAFRRGNRVAVRWTFSGRDTGAFAPNLPSTGKAFSVPASSLFVLRRGKLRRVSDYYNLADLLRQVGLPAGAYTPPAP